MFLLVLVDVDVPFGNETLASRTSSPCVNISTLHVPKINISPLHEQKIIPGTILNYYLVIVQISLLFEFHI